MSMTLIPWTFMSVWGNRSLGASVAPSCSIACRRSANGIHAAAREHHRAADDIAAEAVQAIMVAARTGKIGDGRVFVSPIDRSY